MIFVKLPIYDPIEEDFLRYTFGCWKGTISITLRHPIGNAIYSAIRPSSEKIRLKPETKYLTIAVPHEKHFQFERWPYHLISHQDALRIKMTILPFYQIETLMWIGWGYARGLPMKTAVTMFIDMMQNLAGEDYKLSINYEQVRKMMTREQRKLNDIVKTANQGNKYKAVI